jgi:hypothetical protein
MTIESLDRRFRRRESHRSRSSAVSALLALVIVLCAWIGTEAVLAALGRPPLVATPAAMLATVLRPAPAEAGWVVLGSVVAAVIGIAAIVAAVKPGHKALKSVVGERGSVLVDDSLLAADLGRAARADARGSDVRTVVGRRDVVVEVHPVSGVPVDDKRLGQELNAHAAAIGLRRPLRIRTRVDPRGRVER